jgi:hypothetical protein
MIVASRTVDNRSARKQQNTGSAVATAARDASSACSPNQISAVLYRSATGQDDGGCAAATAALSAAATASAALDAAAGFHGDIG